MDLFLETPQQQAERMLRQLQRLMEMQMQGRQPSPLRKMSCPLLYLQLCPGVNRRQRPIPYSKIHMRRSSRSTSVVRVVAVWASAWRILAMTCSSR